MLRCSSSTPGGWSIVLESDDVDLDGNFLFFSEQRDHTLSFILVSDDSQYKKEYIKVQGVKNGDKAIEVKNFIPDVVNRTFYVSILKGQLGHVPSGYYQCTIRALFVTH